MMRNAPQTHWDAKSDASGPSESIGAKPTGVDIGFPNSSAVVTVKGIPLSTRRTDSENTSTPIDNSQAEIEVYCLTTDMIRGKAPRFPDGKQTAAGHQSNPFLMHPPTCQCQYVLEHLQYQISACENISNPVLDNDAHKLEEYLKLRMLLLSRASVLDYWPLDDVEKLIRVYKDIIRLAPDSLFHKTDYLHDFASVYFVRFQQIHDISDLDRCISAEENAIHIMSDDHSERVSYMCSLAGFLFLRFERLSNLSDINKAISIQQSLIQLTPDPDPDKPNYLSDLVKFRRARFEQLRDASDLDKGVSAQEDAIQLLADDCTERCSHLHSLVSLHYLQFQHRNSLSDIDKTISASQILVQTTPDCNPMKGDYLVGLGYFLFVRYQQCHNLLDLNKSVTAYKDATPFVPGGHPTRREYLNSFAQSLFSRVKRLGDLSDMNKAISINQELIHLTPDGHPETATYLINLGQCLRHRFQLLGNLPDIENSILMGESATQILSDDDHEKVRSLQCLANSLDDRFERVGDVSDIDTSVMWREMALRLIPADNPNKFTYMDSLGTTLCHRFRQLGDVSDINRAVLLGEEGVCLAADDDPRTMLCLHNFGTSLLCHFKSLGDLSDLNKSVSTLRDAVKRAPDSHPLRPLTLNGLGESLLCRFNHFGDTSDIDNAVILQEAAVRLTPDVHPHKPLYLDGLGGIYLAQFRRLGKLSDIEKIISVRKNVLQLLPDGNPSKVKCINNLANALYTRFLHLKDRLRDTGNLDELISMREKALAICPDTNPMKPLFLDNLATALFYRFEFAGNIRDIDRSISVTERAISLIDDHHHERPVCLFNLARSLLMRFNANADYKDLDIAMLHASSAARAPSGLPLARFTASCLWASSARSLTDAASSIEAYTIAFGIIPELAWLGSAITDRYHQVMEVGQMVRDAASAAIEIGQHDTAVEWLEQGRSVIWGQLLQLRTPVDYLREKHPELATRLMYLSKLLETSGTRETPLNLMATGPLKQLESLSIKQHHDFAKERDELLKQIRTLEGFERFLLPKSIAQLLPAADGGPVVLLNTSIYGCDALILIPKLDNIMHVPLNNLTFDNALTLQKSLSNLITNYGRNISFELEAGSNRLKALRIPDDERLADPDAEFARILSQLWIKIAKPVLDALKITTPMTINEVCRRIWWCPTGPLAFLPIHAAGLYGKDQPIGSKLSDFVVSSYTPTLTALVNGLTQGRSRKEQILAVALPSESKLPGTLEELKFIEKHAGSSRFMKILDDKATVDNVSTKMHESSWVHFACHGVQDRSPTESALILTSHSKLTLSKIINLSLPHADFAFLSACQTATGDKSLEEESVHLAAGMLFAGYRGVIATMWSILDNDAPQVADDVYSRLLKGGQLESSGAAEALHLAVERLRNEGKPFISWVPFIHIGV